MEKKIIVKERPVQTTVKSKPKKSEPRIKALTPVYVYNNTEWYGKAIKVIETNDNFKVVDEILDENSIIPCGEREEIVKKLRILYNDKNLCDKILKNSLIKVRQFDWSNIAEKIKRLYKEAIAK